MIDDAAIQMNRKLNTAIAALPAFSIAVLGAWALRDWIVDDAAISYAYARSASSGLGLVSQQYRAPVEGFSNPLWVAAVATVAWIPALEPPHVLKILSWVFFGGCFGVVMRSMSKRGYAPVYIGAWILLLVLQPPLMIWSNSGLETPMLAALVLSYAELLAAPGTDSISGQYRRASWAGFVGACIALTRPEGIAFTFAGVGIVAVTSHARSNVRTRTMLLYAATSGVPCLAYWIFRHIYFGDWLPNTFYAKGGVTSSRVVELVILAPHAVTKGLGLGEAVAGYRGATVACVGFVILGAAAVKRRLISAQSQVYLILTSVAVVVYILLPGDWMGQWRYGVPAILLAWMSVIHLCGDLWPNQIREAKPRAALVLLAGVVVLAFFCWVPRVIEFRDHPALPLEEVIARAVSFEESAKYLGVESPSILTQDVGGFLIRDRLQVYDLGMLTDRRIARDIGEWREPPARADLYEYVFNDLQPTFISVVAFHAWRAGLADDERLARDYVEVRVSVDPWIVRRFGLEMRTGDYVRRSAVQSEEQLVAVARILQSAYDVAPRAESWPF